MKHATRNTPFQITIEGPEGCGKTLLMEAVQLILLSAGAQDVRTQEGPNTPQRIDPDLVVAGCEVWKALGKLEYISTHQPILIKTK